MDFGAVPVNGDFKFPPNHNFPPMYTLQPNEATKLTQLKLWSQTVLSYCRHNHKFRLSLSDAVDSDLFWNKSINRRLHLKDIKTVIEHMISENRAEWVIQTTTAASQSDVAFIHWRLPAEWGELIASWVHSTGQQGTVLTVYELLHGEGTTNQDFHDMDEDILMKGFNELIKRGKASMAGTGQNKGVKIL